MTHTHCNKSQDLINLLFGEGASVVYAPEFEAPRHEAAVIWVVDPKRFRWVRCSLFTSGMRAGKPRVGDDSLLVGYSVLSEDAPRETAGFVRRLFYIRWSDMVETSIYRQTKAAPAEAVIPSSVKPGRWGMMAGQWGAR